LRMDVAFSGKEMLSPRFDGYAISAVTAVSLPAGEQYASLFAPCSGGTMGAEAAA